MTVESISDIKIRLVPCAKLNLTVVTPSHHYVCYQVPQLVRFTNIHWKLMDGASTICWALSHISDAIPSCRGRQEATFNLDSIILHQLTSYDYNNLICFNVTRWNLKDRRNFGGFSAQLILSDPVDSIRTCSTTRKNWEIIKPTQILPSRFTVL